MKLRPIALRHEIGHTIGFRHEQTRPESGTCFEDKNWRPLTSYDAFSVMHYPQCNGKGDWSLILTDQDKNGVACLYGPAAGFTIDNTLVSSTAPCAAADVVPGSDVQPGSPASTTATTPTKHFRMGATVPVRTGSGVIHGG